MTKEIQNKLQEMQEKLARKLLERGEEARDGGGWHDNSALDLINEEISVLEARIRDLKAKL